MERVERLRLKALEPVISRDEFYYHFYTYYIAHPMETKAAQYAEAFYYAFSRLTPSIPEDELIVGNCINTLTTEEQAEWNEKLLPATNAIRGASRYGQDSHMSIDYELLLAKGLRGIMADVDGYLGQCEEEKKPFYLACKRCMEAVIVHAENYAALAETLAETAAPDRREELLTIAKICRKVPAEPAESFYEAVQAANFITHCLSLNPLRINNQLFQPGHPDRYLWPYYERDRKNGVLTKEFAQLLLDCFAIQINMRVPNSLACGYMVGGRDENGQIVENELTYMCMQVIDDIRLVYPGVGLCWTAGMTDACLQTACEILSRGRSHPAIFNDDIVTRGLISYGMPEKEAHSYIHSTCVEITPVASSNVWVASPYTNMPQLLLDVLDKDYEGFDALFAAVLAHLDERIRTNYEAYNRMRAEKAKDCMNPLLSCLVNDCLARGLDIECGGARYNWIMPSFVGVANLVDSLYAVKHSVFDAKELTLEELRAALACNFEDCEPLRLRLLNGIAKYGNDMDEVDRYFAMITDHIIAECEKYTLVFSNGRLIPSVFCWVKHEEFGKVTGATPDGRPAGFPLGDGSGPCQGRELHGPTASILSSTKWEHHKMIGGVAVNMKFAKKSLGPHSIATMANLVKTYMARGGFEMQINVVDRETLLKAQQNPEAYKDLVVRIGGYSDYFVKLSPNMQAEVILRTEHEA